MSLVSSALFFKDKMDLSGAVEALQMACGCSTQPSSPPQAKQGSHASGEPVQVALPRQTSPLVHASPSSHEAPMSTMHPPNATLQLWHRPQSTAVPAQLPVTVHASSVVQTFPSSHAVPVSGVPAHEPSPTHVSLIVHPFPSLHDPPPTGVHVDGVPLHVQHCSTAHCTLQPSPSVRLPSSHASVPSNIPLPQWSPSSVCVKVSQ